jgi:hypothetical protein
MYGDDDEAELPTMTNQPRFSRGTNGGHGGLVCNYYGIWHTEVCSISNANTLKLSVIICILHK